MIYLITGVPRSGKSLRAVEYIEGWLKAGRPVFARIDGLSLEGVKEAPNDWRETPDGSVVVYDEAQEIFGAEGQKAGRSSRPDIQAFETHGHTGHDIVLITQHASLIHSHVRRLVGRHEHIQRVFGSGQVVISWRDRVFDTDSRSERASAVTTNWTHPKRLFGAYKSATMHHSTAKLPGRVKWLGGFALICLLVLGIAVSRLMSGSSQADLIAQATGGVDGVVERAPSSHSSGGAVDHVEPEPWKVRRVVAGCIATISRCQCYTAEGWPIEQEMLECQRFILEPLPVKLAAAPIEQGKGGQGQGREAQRSVAPDPDPVSVSPVAYGGPDPVARSAYVNPVALSAGGGPTRGVGVPAPVPVADIPARLGNVGGGTRPATW